MTQRVQQLTLSGGAVDVGDVESLLTNHVLCGIIWLSG